MAVTLLDTNVLSARASAHDDHHGQAMNVVHGIDHGTLSDGIVTNYVLAETLNLVGERLGTDASNQLLDRLIQGAIFETVHAPKAGFNAAQALFHRYEEQSFVDVTIAAIASTKAHPPWIPASPWNADCSLETSLTFP